MQILRNVVSDDTNSHPGSLCYKPGKEPWPIPSKVFLRPSPPMITSNSYSDTGCVLGCTSARQPIPVDQSQNEDHHPYHRHTSTTSLDTQVNSLQAKNTTFKSLGNKPQKERGFDKGSQRNVPTIWFSVMNTSAWNVYYYVKGSLIKSNISQKIPAVQIEKALLTSSKNNL